MKIKTRLAIAFLTITVVPMLLIYLSVWGLSNYQMNAFRKAYGLSEQVDLLSGNSMQIFNRLTKQTQEEIRANLQTAPDNFADPTYLNQVNENLLGKYAYLIVRREEE
ncbi:MAG: two-component sensor histidine kinase, partial [Hungatella sp.]